MSRDGILYGIGVGPGDPELMTLKAVRYLRECPVLAIPHSSKEQCVSYQIAKQVLPELEEKECLYLPMPMTKDSEILNRCHQEAADQITACLKRGLDVAMITLGDATIYATCLYILERVREAGFETGIINGIPSFCAAAARLNLPLVNGAEELHIIPASYQIEEAMKLSGIKVFMKSGKQYRTVIQQLKRGNYHAVMVENCGMKEEKVYGCLEEMPEEAGYYTLLIVKNAD